MSEAEKTQRNYFIEKLDEIEALGRRADEEYQRLRRSMMLTLADPDAFSAGAATVKFHSTYPHRYPQDFTMYITRGDGTEVTRTLIAYPNAPWLDALKPEGART